MGTISPLAIPLLIALQVERTSFGFHVRECMRSSPTPAPPQANMQKDHFRLTCERSRISGCIPKRELKAENGVDYKHKQ